MQSDRMLIVILISEMLFKQYLIITLSCYDNSGIFTAIVLYFN